MLFKGDKNPNHDFVRRESKPSAWNILRRQNSQAISRQVSPASLVHVSDGNCQVTPVVESVMDSDGNEQDHKWSQYKGRLVRQNRASNNNAANHKPKSLRWN
jgi:hypothetical protein